MIAVIQNGSAAPLVPEHRELGEPARPSEFVTRHRIAQVDDVRCNGIAFRTRR